MKAVLVFSLLFASTAFASQRFGKCTKEEFNKGCYYTVDIGCDPWNVTDTCTFQCWCETEPVKRYPVCAYRAQTGYEYSASSLTLEDACRKAKAACEAYPGNECQLVNKL